MSESNNTAPDPNSPVAPDAAAIPKPKGFTVQYGFVVSAAGVMLAGAWVIATWIQVGLSGDHHVHSPPTARLTVPSQGTRTKALPQGQPIAAALALQSVPSTRTLKQYYSRRAYPGAPPIIPHPIAKQRKGQKLQCLSCHREGGYVPQYKAYTPVTPHPELINCVQCHVPRGQSPAFQQSAWRRPRPPRLGKSALPGGPPVIPHSLQMRENCLACHAGPAAPKEIRTPHPDRVYCKQCHVAQSGASAFRSRFGQATQKTPASAPAKRSTP